MRNRRETAAHRPNVVRAPQIAPRTTQTPDVPAIQCVPRAVTAWISLRHRSGSNKPLTKPLADACTARAAEPLEGFANNHRICAAALEYRQVSKTRSAYPANTLSLHCTQPPLHQVYSPLRAYRPIQDARQ